MRGTEPVSALARAPLYCCTLYNFSFLDFVSDDLAKTDLTLNMNVRLGALGVGPGVRTRPHVPAWRMGVIIVIVEPRIKSDKSYLALVFPRKYLKTRPTTESAKGRLGLAPGKPQGQDGLDSPAAAKALITSVKISAPYPWQVAGLMLLHSGWTWQFLCGDWALKSLRTDEPASTIGHDNEETPTQISGHWLKKQIKQWENLQLHRKSVRYLKSTLYLVDIASDWHFQ